MRCLLEQLHENIPQGLELVVERLGKRPELGRGAVRTADRRGPDKCRKTRV